MNDAGKSEVINAYLLSVIYIPHPKLINPALTAEEDSEGAS